MPQIEMHHDIRDTIAELCEGFPEPYWRKLDEARAYPTDFVRELIAQDYLSALIPEA